MNYKLWAIVGFLAWASLLYSQEGQRVLMADRPEVGGMLSYHNTWSINSKSWGLSFYSRSLKEYNGYMLTFLLSIQKTEYKRVPTPGLLMYYPGVSVFKSFGGPAYLNLAFKVPFGTESGNLIVGAMPSQGIYYFPFKETGPFFGLAIYEYLSTSNTLFVDLGIKLEAGLQF